MSMISEQIKYLKSVKKKLADTMTRAGHGWREMEDIMTGQELSSRLNYAGMEHGIRELAMNDRLAPLKELATLTTPEICNLIVDRYELVYSESEELGLVKKESIQDYRDIVYVISRYEV